MTDRVMVIDPIEFGRVLGRLDAQAMSMAEMKSDIQLLTVAIEKITASQERAAGGFKVAYALCVVIGGAVGATISPLLTLFFR
jgi:hypothetical protein